MIRSVIVLISFCIATTTMAQRVEAPNVNPQDNWTYTNTIENKTGWHQTRDDITVVRSNAKEILIVSKPSGSNMPGKEQMLGPDWSRFRSVNGTETIVSQPMKFPLTTGKSWEIDYTEKNPNREHKSERFQSNYKVIGWESITVPAGTFQAVKIEAEGQWTAEIAPAIANVSASRVDGSGAAIVTKTDKITAQMATGRLYKAVWYVPEIKRYVKTIEEYYGTNGVRSERFTQELEAFKPNS